ncbi:hypothetical protein Pmani_027829 [Petrolisthes manimaculis]|uniref:Uncharacterized protein n=1 Tax=Petrolisthes manimaculis TaxID=1843537 RepID=A0AAE1TWA5_9EUCA|nr:hypothetical protein Pmani_027829 [Petrolisthes manimaculis]
MALPSPLPPQHPSYSLPPHYPSSPLPSLHPTIDEDQGELGGSQGKSRRRYRSRSLSQSSTDSYSTCKYFYNILFHLHPTDHGCLKI